MSKSERTLVFDPFNPEGVDGRHLGISHLFIDGTERIYLTSSLTKMYKELQI